MQENTIKEKEETDAHEVLSAVIEHLGGLWGRDNARQYLIHALPHLATQPDKLADAILFALDMHENKVLEKARRYQLCPCARR